MSTRKKFYVMLIMIYLIVFSAILFILLAVFIGLQINKKRYVTFVLKNSSCLNALKNINTEFIFLPVTEYNQSHVYDNENFYDDISCKDYLIYQLQYQAEKICHQIKNAGQNKAEYQRYIGKIKALQLGNFLSPIGKLKKDKLLKIEKRLCHNTKLSPPVTQFILTVTLYCSKINGVVYLQKAETFSGETILALAKRLKNKVGNYYRDREIWDSICRVERGKVSNKMRFSIYARDGYRCQHCGVSQSRAVLEIDHIIPIAKGGKSTYDNLQTLCHNCNIKKGDKF